MIYKQISRLSVIEKDEKESEVINDLDSVIEKINEIESEQALMVLERQILILESLDGSKIWRSDGIFDWVTMMMEIDDHETIEICGTDSAIYLEFLE